MIRWGLGRFCLLILLSFTFTDIANARSKRKVISVDYNKSKSVKYSKKQKRLRRAVKHSQSKSIKEHRSENLVAYIDMDELDQTQMKKPRRVSRKISSVNKMPEKKVLPKDPSENNPLVEDVSDQAIVQNFQKNIRIQLDDDYLNEDF